MSVVENNSTTQGLKNSQNFKFDKNKTHDYFKSSKVESCSHVLVNGGQTVAVPFKITNKKGNPLQQYKFGPSRSSETNSIYRKDYSVKPNMHVGMDKKPLVPYHPESYRNRLPIGGVIMPHKNKSIVEIGDRGMVNRKQWKSIARDTYTTPKSIPIANTGIISDMTKRLHRKLESIN